MKVIVIGVDPGIANTGLAVISLALPLGTCYSNLT